ncbi:MAG: hypothetical protein AAF721_11355, partial [Myxococcota bacterium]
IGLTVAVAATTDAPSEAELAALVGQELAAAGHRVQDWPRALADNPDDLLARARAEELAMALGITVPEAPDAVRLVLVDRVTGKTLSRDLAGAEGRLPSVVALAAAELVEATLVELYLPPPPAAPREYEIPPGLVLPRLLTPAPPPRWEVGAAAGAIWPARQRRAAAAVRIEVGTRITERLVVSARGATAVHPIADRRSSAELRSLPLHAALGLRVDLLDPDWPWRLAADAAFGVSIVVARGDAAPPLSVNPSAEASAAVTAGLLARRRIARRGFVGVRVDAVVVFVAPRLRIAGETVQDYGPVWLQPVVAGGVRW